ncbi:MAG: YCF48-related protein [Anaerolineales bacterium]
MSMKFATLLSFYSLAAVILAACQPPATLAPIPIITANPVQSTSTVTSFPVTGTPELTPTIEATWPPFPTLDIYAIPSPLSLSSIKMIDEMNGWGVAVNDDTSLERLVRTSDGGKTWADVTPVEHLGVTRYFFLDAEMAWIKEWTREGEFLYRTKNSGKTWESLPLPPNVDGLQFIDTSTGWAVSKGSCGATCPVALYQTNDGGQTWVQLRVNSIDGKKSPNVPEGGLDLPYGGEFLFRGPTNIWIARTLFKYFYVSWDGGKTWQVMDMPFKDKVFSDNDIYPNVNFLSFFGDRLGYVTTRYQKNSQTGDVQRLIAIFATQDGGKTWTQRSSLAQKLFRPDYVDFVSADVAFTACDSGLCVTHDGAQTWQPIQLNAQQKNFFDGIGEFDIDFVTPNKGWLLGWNFELGGEITLYTTDDGGMTWIPLPMQVTRGK